MNQDAPSGQPLGMVVDGSLSKGVEVRLHPDVSVEDVQEGIYVTIRGQRRQFFGMVTDVSLGATDPRFKQSTPDVSDPFIARAVSGTVTFGTVSALPMLTMPAVLGGDEAPQPAKTIPAHFSPVHRASDRDVELVFGKEDGQHFFIGNPLDMETKVCLNVEELVKRSTGVFGKSGTGKTFLTRLLLVGILQSRAASCLIFDMHNEYGWAGQDADRNRTVKGLKQLFGPQVSVFTLDPESSARRGAAVDFEVQVGYNEIEPEDVSLLRQTLNLSEVAASASYDLERRFGPGRWLQAFLALERPGVMDLAQELNVNGAALATLHNRLGRLKRYGFMVERALDDSVRRILENLDRGMHVVLEFGRYGNDLAAYIMVANLLTRRIHQQYVQLKEKAEGDPRAREPRPLVICIEEAHRFLNPEIASHTIFGSIARELRKYNVTLMVIDQRPSAIDSEVMSQIGTKVTCLLDNERDVEACLSGAPGRRELRSVLERLDPRQQALIFGHAVPLPVVVRIREYGAGGSYGDLTRPSWQNSGAGPADDESLDDLLKDLL